MSFWTRSPAPAAAEPESLGDVLAEVRRIEVQSSRLVTDVLAGGYRSTFRGAGVEFADVREYVEGDDPRSIDWNVTARAGRLFVKHFVEERELTVLFVLDLAATMDAGFGGWSMRQAAARFCALLGLAAIANNDRIGLCAGSTGVERYVPPKKGAGHVLRVVRDVLVLRGASRGRALGALLGELSRRQRRRAVVFLLSDFFGELPQAELAVAGRRHDLVAVRLLPPELADPPPLLLRTLDPETGRASPIDFRAGAVRDAWAAKVAAWRHRLDEQFGRALVDVIDVPIPAAPEAATVAQPLLRFFRQRELRAVR